MAKFLILNVAHKTAASDDFAKIHQQPRYLFQIVARCLTFTFPKVVSQCIRGPVRSLVSMIYYKLTAKSAGKRILIKAVNMAMLWTRVSVFFDSPFNYYKVW